MAIEKLILDSGRVSWRARWRDDRNRQRSRSFRRKVDAERFMTELQHAKHSGTYVDPLAGRMKFGEWAGRWMDAQLHLKPKTVAGYRSLLATTVLPRWGSVPLGRITFSGVAEWVNDLQREGRSASRVRQAYHLTTGILHAAVNEGEAAALRVSGVDLERGRLNITQAASEVNGQILLGSPKSHQARWLPVPAFLMEELQGEVEGRDPDDLVFQSPQGAVMRSTSFRRGYFDRAAADTGVPGFVPHELRHTAASLAISAGATVKSVQRMLGRASATLTLDRYGHLFPDEFSWRPSR